MRKESVEFEVKEFWETSGSCFWMFTLAVMADGCKGMIQIVGRHWRVQISNAV